MRWDDLFTDLEMQLESELTAEECDREADELRLRAGRLSLRDRVIAVGSAPITFLLPSTRLVVLPQLVGVDWVSASSERGSCVIPLAAVEGLLLPTQPHVGAPTATSPRLSLAVVMRDLCRRRAAVTLPLAGGTLHGTIDSVGEDHLDLAVHEPGTPRRRSAVTENRIVAFRAVELVWF